MMIVLLFSVTVTMLCCYSVSLMLATKEKNTHNTIYITLYHKDNTALKKPITLHTAQPSFVKKSKINADFIEVDNMYPIMPHNKYSLPQLDVRV